MARRRTHPCLSAECVTDVPCCPPRPPPCITPQLQQRSGPFNLLIGPPRHLWGELGPDRSCGWVDETRSRWKDKRGRGFSFLPRAFWMLHISCFSPDERMFDETAAAVAAPALHKQWEGSSWVKVDSNSPSEGNIGGFALTSALWGKVTFCFSDSLLASKSAFRLLEWYFWAAGSWIMRWSGSYLRIRCTCRSLRLISLYAFSVASARRPASHITIFPLQYGSTSGAARSDPCMHSWERAVAADRSKVRKLKDYAPPQSNVTKSDFCLIPHCNLPTVNPSSPLCGCLCQTEELKPPHGAEEMFCS